MCCPARRRRQTTSWCARSLALALGVCLASPSFAASGTWLSNADGLWFDPANWSSNPVVPNGPDHTATLPSVITNHRTVTLDSPVTLGQLYVNAYRRYTLAGTTTNFLTFESTNGPAGIHFLGTSSLYGHTIAAPVSLNSNFRFYGATTGIVSLTSPWSGPGNLTVDSAGTARFSAANTLAGAVVVDRGTLALTNTGSLLDITSLTINSAGVLSVASAPGNTPGSNAIRPNSAVFHGGTLAIAADLNPSLFFHPSSTAIQIAFAGGSGITHTSALNLSTVVGGVDDGNRVVIHAGSTTTASNYNGTLSYTPGATHTTLTVGGGSRNARLNIYSDLTAANGITGIVKQGPDTIALYGNNTYTGQTIVKEGTLAVRSNNALGAGSGSDADGTFLMPGTTLSHAGGITDISIATEKITLDHATIHMPAATGSLTLGPVHTAGDSQITGPYSPSDNLRIDGPITGPGHLTVDLARVVLLRGPASHAGTTLKTGELQVSGNGSLVNAGVTEVGSKAQLSLYRPVGEDPVLNATAPHSIDLRGGRIHLNTNSDPQMLLHPDSVRGTVYMSTLNTHPINVDSMFPASFEDKIIVGNVSGPISFNTPSTLRISAISQSDLLAANNILNVEGGGILSGTLTYTGYTRAISSLEIRSPVASSGPVYADGILTLSFNGSVANASHIEVNSALVLETGADDGITASGRVNSPVFVNDGVVSVEIGFESFPAIHAQSGRVVINTYLNNSNHTHGAMHIVEVHRQPGTSLVFAHTPVPPAKAITLGTPVLSNGILVDSRGTVLGTINYVVSPTSRANAFATYTTDGVVPLTTYHNDFATATATSNLKVTTPQTLQADRTFHTLTTSINQGHAIDTNGHRLTLAAGGVFLMGFAVADDHIIGSGSVTAGAGNELVLLGNGGISAAIVDRAPGEPLAVNIAGGIKLTGHNTYSGPTYLNGPAQLANTAIPSTTTLYLNMLQPLSGTELIDTSGIVFVEGLVLRGGKLQSKGAALHPNTIIAEEGVLSVPLQGSATIHKNTPGVIEVASDLTAYEGQIRLSNGTLILTAPTAGSKPIVIESGLIRPAQTVSPMSHALKVYGGEIHPLSTSSTSISYNGTIDFHGNARIRTMLDGTYWWSNTIALTLTNAVTIDTAATVTKFGGGDLTFRSSLHVDGTLLADDGSDIIVTPVAATISGKGAIHAKTTLNANTTLSPGSPIGDDVATLTLDSLTLVGNAADLTPRLLWTIHDGDGIPGVSADFALITDELAFSATSTSPIRIALTGDAAAFDRASAHQWPLFAADHIAGFDPAAFIIDEQNLAAAGGASGGFYLTQEGNTILINYAPAIPEPSTLSLLAGFVALYVRRTRRRAS